jgi:hypothetical protein
MSWVIQLLGMRGQELNANAVGRRSHQHRHSGVANEISPGIGLSGAAASAADLGQQRPQHLE